MGAKVIRLTKVALQTPVEAPAAAPESAAAELLEGLGLGVLPGARRAAVFGDAATIMRGLDLFGIEAPRPIPVDGSDDYVTLVALPDGSVEFDIDAYRELAAAAAERPARKDEDFVYPGGDGEAPRYPVHTLVAARESIAAVDREGTDDEAQAVREAAFARYPRLREQ